MNEIELIFSDFNTNLYLSEDPLLSALFANLTAHFIKHTRLQVPMVETIADDDLEPRMTQASTTTPSLQFLPRVCIVSTHFILLFRANLYVSRLNLTIKVSNASVYTFVASLIQTELPCPHHYPPSTKCHHLISNRVTQFVSLTAGVEYDDFSLC